MKVTRNGITIEIRKEACIENCYWDRIIFNNDENIFGLIPEHHTKLLEQFLSGIEECEVI